MTLLFIESPLQIINAYEAIEKYNIKQYDIIVRLSNIKQNDEQIIYIITRLKIDNILFVNIRIKNKKIIDYLKLFFYRFRYVFLKIDKVFIGNYESGFFRLILKQFSKNQIILMDDGAKTINIQNNFRDTLNYNLFTMFDFKPYKNQIIVKNNYQLVQKNLQNLKIEEEKILFLGLKLSEINIVSQKYYLQQIDKIANYYKDKKIIYIPHRGENQDKIAKINKISNLEVVQLHYPIELYGLYNKNIPYKVCSFYSTALFTMKNIYNLEVESFMFDYDKTKYKKIIDSVYNYYDKYIKVTNLYD